MTINEKGLLKCMRDSYKHGGYHVAATVYDAEEWLMITSYGYSWMVMIQWDNVPRKVLGLIAEHIGKLPLPGEAFSAKKDEEAQDEIYEVAVRPLTDLVREHREKDCPLLRKTKLIWDCGNVWQQEESQKSVLLDPQYESIAILRGNQLKLVGCWAGVQGKVSRAYISKRSFGDQHKAIEGHMELILWA